MKKLVLLGLVCLFSCGRTPLAEEDHQRHDDNHHDHRDRHDDYNNDDDNDQNGLWWGW